MWIFFSFISLSLFILFVHTFFFGFFMSASGHFHPANWKLVAGTLTRTYWRTDDDRQWLTDVCKVGGVAIAAWAARLLIWTETNRDSCLDNVDTQSCLSYSVLCSKTGVAGRLHTWSVIWSENAGLMGGKEKLLSDEQSAKAGAVGQWMTGVVLKTSSPVQFH